MTEAARRWVYKAITLASNPDPPDGWHCRSEETLLRAFVDEVKNRACGESSTDYREENIGWAFKLFATELLGEWEK